MNPTTSSRGGDTTTPQFKPGDRVRRTVGSFGKRAPGKEAIVKAQGGSQLLYLEGDTYTYDARYFRLVAEAPERTLTATAIRQSRRDWKAAVANGSTTVSLEEWRKSPEYDTPVEPEMPLGIYVATAHKHRPEISAAWRHSSEGWKALTSGDFRYADHPKDLFTTGNWWEKVTRLVAE